MTATIVDNVLRWLEHFGLAGSISIFDLRPDRVFANPNGPALMDRITAGLTAGDWGLDPQLAAKAFHGKDVVASYREASGCHPSMQVTVHRDGVYEIDFDFADPTADIASAFVHAGEVLHNHRAHELTDQERISVMLDKRGIA